MIPIRHTTPATDVTSPHWHKRPAVHAVAGQRDPQPAAMAAARRAETTFTICKAPRNYAACSPKNRKRPARLAGDERDQLPGPLKLPQHRGDQVQRRPDRIILLGGR